MESTQKFSKYSSNLVIEGSIKFIRTIVINYLLNVAPKKEMVYLFIYLFLIIFQKSMSVCPYRKL